MMGSFGLQNLCLSYSEEPFACFLSSAFHLHLFINVSGIFLDAGKVKKLSESFMAKYALIKGCRKC